MRHGVPVLASRGFVIYVSAMWRKTMLTIRLPQDIEARLAALAVRTGRSRAFHAREAIMRHLEDMEDYFLAAEAHAAHVVGGEGAVSLDEAAKHLGLEVDQIGHRSSVYRS